MRLEHHLVGGYVRYISPHIIIIIKLFDLLYDKWSSLLNYRKGFYPKKNYIIRGFCFWKKTPKNI